MRRMSLRHARVLLALNDTGSISAAADQLHVTQPAVSKTLAELEQGLGQTLFVRRGRNMQPTPLGRRLLTLARKLDADLQRAAGDVATMVRGASGEVRIGATNASLARLLPVAITAMKRENPGVTLSIRTHALRSLFAELLAGTLDLVVARAMPQDEPLGLARVSLRSQPEVLTMSAQHPLARTPRLSWEVLGQQRWIWQLPGTRTRTLMDRLWQEMGLAPPTDLIESGDAMLALGLMREMPLVAVMPHDMAMAAAKQEVVVILPHAVDLGLGPMSVWHLPDTQVEAVDRFRQLLVEAAGSEGGKT
ncbi:LysR family transcriptional regulator [Mitsuaria sp. 7]|uniref:LysR family transcriptional regulator n=1 Tax=Mitsuaria sp. 7 TaxID=1658665 RepID=UPI0018D45796|nr:LysR substrate-binding domain-containing protein [Mitsuaria sp. 7]